MLALVVSLDSGNSIEDGLIQPRIVGGEVLNETAKVPHMASLWIIQGLVYICAGSIITYNHILTAAHCLDSIRSPRDLMAVVGSTKLDTGDEKFSIIRTFIHEDYDKITTKNDIGIVQTAGYLYGKAVGTIRLSVNPTPPQTLYLYGWGFTSVRTVFRSGSWIFILLIFG